MLGVKKQFTNHHLLHQGGASGRRVPSPDAVPRGEHGRPGLLEEQERAQQQIPEPEVSFKNR